MRRRPIAARKEGTALNVKDLMTRNVSTCRPGDTLDALARILWESDCGSAPVVDEAGTVVGMITDRDACMAAWTRGKPLYEIRVEEVMSRDVQRCTPLDTLSRAAILMRE